MNRPSLSCCCLLAVLTAASLAQPPDPAQEPPHFIRIKSKASLIHLGSLDSFDTTKSGTAAASLVLDCVTRKDPQAARAAQEIYQRIIPSENFGGEYTALEWICEFMAATKADQARMLADPLTAGWHQYLSQDDFEPLRDYLKKKYHLLEWKDRKTPKSEPEFRFLEDFILFNNPRRERWERTSRILEILDLKKGDIVADIGCGPGYYSFKFAEAVGDSGFVYAVDTNLQHLDYMRELAQQMKLKNLETVEQQRTGLVLPKKADLVYVCSLYHNIYALDTDDERGIFVNSLKKALKPDGSLVIVDNGMVEDQTLPYHGPHIAKELIINQLWYYGFRLVRSEQFIPQRYALIFKMIPGPDPSPASLDQPLPEDCVPTVSQTSLVRSLKTTTSPGFTLAGRKAARLLHAALETKTPDTIRAALDAYRNLVPKERFGDEYLALQWICEYLLAAPPAREQMLSRWFVRDYFERLAGDDFKLMKTYLQYKYYFDAVLDDDDVARAAPGTKRIQPHEAELPASAPVSQDQLNEWGDFIAFNSPYRENWEHTAKVIEFLKIKPGDRIADLGCGPGYYTFKFSELVGTNGYVYAVDTLQSMLDFVNGVCTKHGVRNVGTILARDNDTKLPADSVDLVYICSMYHAIYMTALEYVKDGFLSTLKNSLRKGARVVIADNAILRDSENPYYGPRIAPELIISQMKHYGFSLVDRTRTILQRYVLVFQLEL